MDMFEGVGRRLDQSSGSFLNIGQHSLNGRERNCLFRNNGDGTFTDVAWVDGADRVEDGRGLSVVDLDGDGRVDLVIRNYRQPAVVLHNVGPARHWLELQLVGVRSNRDAVGARVRVQTAAGWQTREVHAGSGYLSGSSLVQHFGLGDERRASAVEISWPSGVRTTLRDVAADRRYRIVEGDAAAVALR
ncbi:MAG TPA: CRTAC1 family protein [Candidatus Binatia bacterium]|nr:CRTAC1 family protein [Candidatus Binatia bacterium]